MSWLSDRDDEYVGKLREMRPRAATKAEPHSDLERAQDALVGLSTMNTRETMPSAREFSPAYERALQYGSTAARYALPAAGVTAAGIALMDVASAFGGNADQPEQNQLGLNNGEMSALGVVLASPLIAAGAGAGMGMFEGEEITAGNSQISDYERQVNEAYAQSNADAIAKEASQRARGTGRTNLGQLPRSSRRR